MSSIQNHFAASQPEELLGKRQSHTEASIVPRRSIAIDHFTLYLLNNIQLPPKVLEEARLSLQSATSGLNDHASGAASYKPNSIDRPTECPASGFREASHSGAGVGPLF